MADEVFKRDPNHIPVVAGVTDDASLETSQLRVDPVTRRLKVDASMSSDIEIGAVEIKNNTDDTRAIVTAANALKVDGSAVAQPVTDNGGAITVDANNLDIRDLTSVNDSVEVKQSVNASLKADVTSNAQNIATQTTLNSIDTKLVSGTDIGDVTINNGGTTNAVNIQDGGNAITVDGTVAVSNMIPAVETGLATSSNQTNGTQKVKITDGYGFMVEATPMDELRVANPVRLVGSTFTGSTIDPNFWTVTILASGGTIATADLTTMPGALTLQSKTDGTGSVIVQSVRSGRYIGGSSNRYRAQVQFGDTGVANNTKRWGMFDGTNGAYFKLEGTAMSVCTMKGGVEVPVASAAWNGSTTVPTLTNVNTYEIYITNAKVYFVIAGTMMHTATFSTTTWSATTTLPVRADNINATNTTNTIMYIRVMTIYRLGELETLTTFKRITTAATYNCKYGAGNLHRITLNNPTGTLITIYDGIGVTTNIIGVINTPATANPTTLEYHVPFSVGLTIVTTGTWDATVIYE
jgi:hypothetical protein